MTAIRQLRPSHPTIAAALVGAVCLASPLTAQDAGGADAAALAKQLTNPISSLISVPFQLNYDDGYGTGDGQRTTLNIQPVVPRTLNPEWNLIVRTILPVTYQTDFAPGAGSQFGLGDTVQSFFLSPQAPGPGGLIWGVGPVFLWPTATENELGSDKWGAGPTGVALVQRGPWTVGALANHIWSFAGEGDRADVNATFLQPFVAYTTPRATSISLNTESTYDWDAEEWSVPVNFQVSQVLKIGEQPVQIGGGVRYWLDAPDGGPDGWGFRLNFALLFPR
jgi:hypothetical protein